MSEHSNDLRRECEECGTKVENYHLLSEDRYIKQCPDCGWQP